MGVSFVLKIIHVFKNIYFVFWCVWIFSCMYVSVPCMCLVSIEASRRCQILGKWLCATMQVLGIEPDPLEEHQLLLVAKPFFLALKNATCFFWKIFIVALLLKFKEVNECIFLPLWFSFFKPLAIKWLFFPGLTTLSSQAHGASDSHSVWPCMRSAGGCWHCWLSGANMQRLNLIGLSGNPHLLLPFKCLTSRLRLSAPVATRCR